MLQGRTPTVSGCDCVKSSQPRNESGVIIPPYGRFCVAPPCVASDVFQLSLRTSGTTKPPHTHTHTHIVYKTPDISPITFQSIQTPLQTTIQNDSTNCSHQDCRQTSTSYRSPSLGFSNNEPTLQRGRYRRYQVRRRASWRLLHTP